MMTTDVAQMVRRLADRLVATPMGELVSLDDLSQAIGQNIKMVRYLIYKAKNLAEKESGALFATEYKKGYRRLHSNEIVKIGQSARKHIRNTSRRASKGISAGVQVANDLTPSELNAVLREQSALGLLEHLAKDRALPKVDEAEKRPLTPAQVARQFLDSVGGLK